MRQQLSVPDATGEEPNDPEEADTCQSVGDSSVWDLRLEHSHPTDTEWQDQNILQRANNWEELRLQKHFH